MRECNWQRARIRIIDQMLQKGIRVKTMEMVNKCIKELGTNISQRQIQKDIDLMRSDPPYGYGAPIEHDASQKAFFYSKDFTLDAVHLRKEEVESLKLAASILYQFRDLGNLRHVRSAIEKVRFGVNVAKTEGDLEIYDSRILPESSEGLEWQRHFAPLYDAIEAGRRVRLSYQRFGESEQTDRVVSPFVLKESKNRWYLVGYCHKRQALRSFGLDRIHEVRTQEEEALPMAGHFDPKEYYESVLWVTGSSQPPCKVVLEFFGKAKNLVQTVPLHRSQKVVDQSLTSVTVEICVYNTVELHHEILSYGADVKVLEPLEFREAVIEHLRAGISRY